jgi:hypothetical protein
MIDRDREHSWSIVIGYDDETMHASYVALAVCMTRIRADEDCTEFRIVDTCAHAPRKHIHVSSIFDQVTGTHIGYHLSTTQDQHDKIISTRPPTSDMLLVSVWGVVYHLSSSCCLSEVQAIECCREYMASSSVPNGFIEVDFSRYFQCAM